MIPSMTRLPFGNVAILLAACQTASPPAGPDGRSETPQLAEAASSGAGHAVVCDGTRELEDGSSFALRFDATGDERFVSLVATLPVEPYSEELRLKAYAEPPVEPRRLAFVEGGGVVLEHAFGSMRARIAWPEPPAIAGVLARASELEFVCDDGSAPEPGELNALSLEQMGPHSLRRPLGRARERARELLEAEPKLVAVDAAPLAPPAPPACEGFAELTFTFRAGADDFEVKLLPRPAGEDCIYPLQSEKTAKLRGRRPLAEAGGLDGVVLGYSTAVERARRRFPQLMPMPAFSLMAPERLAPAGGSSYYRLFGIACGRKAEVLVDAASGEVRPGDPAPGECR
jgi:hypothetical protein